jgi:uncharacterized protein
MDPKSWQVPWVSGREIGILPRPKRRALVLCRVLTAKSKSTRFRPETAPRPPHHSALPWHVREAKLFARGVALFNSRHFFEAHEAWEEIWLHTQPPEKTFLQGLIQVTAAFHHHQRSNRRGFKSLLHAGLTKLEAFPPEHRGLQIEGLRAAGRRWLAALDHQENTRFPALPRISRSRKSG